MTAGFPPCQSPAHLHGHSLGQVGTEEAAVPDVLQQLQGALAAEMTVEEDGVAVGVACIATEEMG